MHSSFYTVYTNLQILLFISSYIATFVDPKGYIFTMVMFTLERFFIFVVLFVKQVEIFTRSSTLLQLEYI